MTENQPTTAATMRLRADPPRIVRLSPKVLVALAAAASVGVGSALIYALQTSSQLTDTLELYSTSSRPTADGLGSLPRDYTGPVLGPALPGDLGRPILDAQNRGQPAISPMISAPTVDEAEQRRRAEEEAARTSKVFFQTEPGRAVQPSSGAAFPGLATSESPERSGAPNAQDRQHAFLGAGMERRTLSADRILPPASPFMLQAGAVIPSALITGIRSDLPGQITAQVTENVYDSPSGRVLLVPQGTRVIGEYDNGVGFGQRRVLLVWNRLVFPNGRSIVLERQPGADTQGYAGLEDGVDHHWWDLLKAAGLSTLLGIGAEIATDDNDRLIRAIRSGAQDTINQAGQQIVQRQLQVAPTLTIRPGFPVRVIVTRDLVLEPYGG
ncbi:TrbI/VirB10 family protein [Mesorhizobium sp. NPDC059054]|uniref:TrbI/VirB10 family protein n=1 Tax=Mesorhizobium sp. NPDC059054 TaxID=3346711 RepID=UPI0036780477